jgi:hypothetical protein
LFWHGQNYQAQTKLEYDNWKFWTMEWRVFCVREHTGVVGWECSRLWEITVPWIPAGSLVEEIHGISSMRCYRVRFKASPAWLDWTTVDSGLSTSIIQVRLQLGIWNSCLWHTPCSSFLRLWWRRSHRSWWRRNRSWWRSNWSSWRRWSEKENVSEKENERMARKCC